VGAKAGTLTLPARGVTWQKAIWLIVISGMVAMGLLIGLVLWDRGGSSVFKPSRVSVTHPVSGTVVTGTGPGLVQIADRVKAALQPDITETGPGLVEIARGAAG